MSHHADDPRSFHGGGFDDSSFHEWSGDLSDAEENLHLPYLGHCALLYSPRVARAVCERLKAD